MEEERDGGREGRRGKERGREGEREGVCVNSSKGGGVCLLRCELE